MLFASLRSVPTAAGGAKRMSSERERLAVEERVLALVLTLVAEVQAVEMQASAPLVPLPPCPRPI